MSFFDDQESAKASTFRLLWLFTIGVILLGLLSTFALAFILWFNGVDAWNWSKWGSYYLITAISTWAFIVIVSGVKYWSMTYQGGISLALDLRGRLLEATTKNKDNIKERQLLNIVEEMSIASSVPRPEIFIFSEPSINAFAAGFEYQDAIIGVTQGALDQLSRDELQGVIAHEFSHILHGDMRLNMRIMGVLHGMMALATFGKFFLRHSTARRRAQFGPLAVGGLVLWLIGSLGNLFGSLIQAAVSRQREFLADASAVQFTRNPQGIADALKRILHSSRGGLIDSHWASEMKHFFIVSPLASQSFFQNWTVSHPPLEIRIQRILKLPQPYVPTEKAMLPRNSLHDSERTTPPSNALSLSPMTYAAIHEIYSVRSVIYACFLAADHKLRETQLSVLTKRQQQALRNATERVYRELAEQADSLRLPIIELAIPTLKRLSPGQRTQFFETLKEILLADGKIDLQEYLLFRILFTASERRHFTHRTPTEAQLHSAYSVVYSLIYHLSSDKAQSSSDFFQQVSTGHSKPLVLKSLEECPPEVVHGALQILSELPIHRRQQILTLAGDLLLSDSVLKPREAELFFCLCLSLFVPMPVRVAKVWKSLRRAS